MLGFLYGALTGRRYDVEITLKVVESDKRRMVADYNTHQRSLAPGAEGKALARGTDVRMPPLAFGRPDAALPLGVVHTRLEAPLAPGWHTFRTPVQFIVAGKLPWLSRDSMMIPLAKNDGLIDVVMVPPRSALASIKVGWFLRSMVAAADAGTERRRPGGGQIYQGTGLLLLQSRGVSVYAVRALRIHQHRRCVRPPFSRCDFADARCRREHTVQTVPGGEPRTAGADNEHGHAVEGARSGCT
jgi:hypothetical protein